MNTLVFTVTCPFQSQARVMFLMFFYAAKNTQRFNLDIRFQGNNTSKIWECKKQCCGAGAASFGRSRSRNAIRAPAPTMVLIMVRN
jgi:hypothetical protein